MSVWGKLAGAAAGLAIGGPIGALLGGVVFEFTLGGVGHTGHGHHREHGDTEPHQGCTNAHDG